MRWILAVALALAPAVASVMAAPNDTARHEIASLIGALDGSPCRFQRNGRWHDAAEARAHLQRKYDYLLRKDKVDTAEQFIERAASRSSVSGQPYRIACPGQPGQSAASWFGTRLQALRTRGTPAA